MTRSPEATHGAGDNVDQGRARIGEAGTMTTGGDWRRVVHCTARRVEGGGERGPARRSVDGDDGGARSAGKVNAVDAPLPIGLVCAVPA